ncbi:type VI secretion system-associated FHA domain protein TagH [Thalassobaculum sp.]|uniref:type VI secretion system-associated FHA domain protein TagH n=1 Tax=Thalassobaculum sp. TaxID=2022740 RepID=UPI0032EB6874
MEIISFQKSLMGDAQSHTFTEAGGSIGRGRDNSWILPDPNRYISSRHAEIDCSGGQFRVTDISTNGVFVNGDATALGRDQHAVLSNGDRLVLGDYEIAVRIRDGAAQQRPGVTMSVNVGSALLGGVGTQPPKDILDVVDRRGNEPRLGRLEIPDDAFDQPPLTSAKAPPPTTSRPTPAPAPLRKEPIPPPPPRRTAPAPTAPAPKTPPATKPRLPEDIDFKSPVSEPPPSISQTPPVQPAAAPTSKLPDDFDALLPDSPPPVTPPATERGAPPPGIVPSRPPVPPTPAPAATRPMLPDDDFDDLLPQPIAPPAPAPVKGVLPDNVPLLRPVPGTGNGPEPLSPVPHSSTSPSPADQPLDGEKDETKDLPSGVPSNEPVLTALATGLGVDPSVLEGMDSHHIIELVGRAARSAALGIAGAFDARNALARAAGIDPNDLGQDQDNPFLVFRSGEAALKQSLSNGIHPAQSLDAATRQSVAALSANSSAAASALEALLDQFASGHPPQSADAVREIFGAAFVTAYHREIGRLK